MKDLVPTPIMDSYAAYGCKVNAIDVAELFRRYQETGFLYPAKLQRLGPYMDVVKHNWRHALRGGELIHYIITYEEPETEIWGAISTWRSTRTGWNTQHLVTSGGALASRALMLSGQAVILRDNLDTSHQNWFQPSNRFANKVFGSLAATLGPTAAAVGHYNYIAVPLNFCCTPPSEVKIRKCDASNLQSLCAIAKQTRSSVYVEAEQLAHEDVELDTVDQLYGMVGLRRFRKIWLAYLKPHTEPVGAVLAYRGPLGFNFSFIENRCDLLIRPQLSEAEVDAVSKALLHAAASAYEDFLPQKIFVVADPEAGSILIQNGGKLIRQYAQSIWLRSGYEQNYRHVEHFYDRIIRAGKRRGVGTKNCDFG